ncbi:MAG TPA: MFS transporter [Vicinamibacteria bacterium]|nr:MFS transporter [Vicinamibacteria bacterium]
MKTSYPMVALVFLIFFAISLLTNILGPLIPDIIRSFSLTLGLAGFLPFSFFAAYAVMSIPSGMLVERFREKAVIAAAFGVAFLGSIAFALVPTFAVGLASLFLIGIGMAMLQVAINPLLRVAGGEAHFAFFSVAAQLVFGLASFLSPHVYAYLVSRLGPDRPPANVVVDALARVVPAGLPWISLYWVFAVVTAIMTTVVLLARFPKVELTDAERAGAWATHRALLRNPHVLLYALGIFCYVGAEQGIANWISQFLSSYHGFDPQTVGAAAVGRFWLLMTVGCLLGLLLLKLMDSRQVLKAASAAAILTLAVALFAGGPVALHALPLTGFFLSVMWSIIFALALNSVAEHHGSFSGILCTAIVGGAILPLLVGWLGDQVGLRYSMLVLFVPLGYILAIGFWSRPLIANETIGAKRDAPAAA